MIPSFSFSTYQLVSAFHRHIVKPVTGCNRPVAVTDIPYKLILLQNMAHEALTLYILLHCRDEGMLHREVLMSELALTGVQFNQYVDDLVSYGLMQQTSNRPRRYSTNLRLLQEWPEVADLLEKKHFSKTILG